MAHADPADEGGVGKRVRGVDVPKDPGIDSKSPFKDIKVGTQTSD